MRAFGEQHVNTEFGGGPLVQRGHSGATVGPAPDLGGIRRCPDHVAYAPGSIAAFQEPLGHPGLEDEDDAGIPGLCDVLGGS